MFYHYPKVFTDAQCQSIIDMDKTLESQQIMGSITDTSIRSSKGCGLYTLPSEFAGVLSPYIRENPYNLSVSPEPYSYTVYEVGDHYTWHTDIIEGMQRKISVSILLNDGFVGGEFEYLNENRTRVSVSMDRGDLIMFPSWYKHQVRGVSSGVRISLVGWYG